MGSGSSIRHQTHHVHTGLAAAEGTAAAPEPPSGPGTSEPASPHTTAIELLTPESTAIRSLAFAHPDNPSELGQLDVTWHSSGSTYRFDVPVETWTRLRQAADIGDSIGRFISGEVSRVHEGRIIRDEDSLLHQAAPAASTAPAHCPSCGQFIGATAHTCPVTSGGTQHQYWLSGTAYANTVHLPNALTYVRQTDQPLFVPASGRVGGVWEHDIQGTVGLYNPAGDLDLDRAAAGLQCDCGQSGCEHAWLMAAGINDQLRLEARQRQQLVGVELLRRMAHSANPLPGLPTSQGRCQTCGQFTGAVAHDCPAIENGLHYHDTRRGIVATPHTGYLARYCDFSNGPLMIPLQADMSFPGDNQSHSVTGHARLFPPQQPPDWRGATDNLTCTCGQANCVHMLGATAVANDRFRHATGGSQRADRTLTWSGQARCRRCGRFIGEAVHDCPVDGASLRRYVNDYGQVRIPNVTALRDGCEFDSGDVHIPVQGQFQFPDEPRHQIQGDVIVPAARAEFDPVAASSQLTCECGQPGCRHAQLAAAEVVDRLRAPRISQPDRRATTAVLQRLAVEHEASVTAQSLAQEATTEATSYTDNPQAFQSAYRAALDRHARGEAAVPYLLENATGGLGARDGGRAFGVELEFDLPDVPSRSTALDAIARDMHAAGISQHSEIRGYHSSQRDGYSEARDAWRLEYDGTVAGEVVSPILYDTPETWQDLQTVCDIIRRHGGRASVRTGGHVHVSAGNYDHTVANHNRLLRMTESHADTLFRLAANPGRRRHRGTTWCAPNTVPAAGYRSVDSARYNNESHGLALNLESMYGRNSDHVEFRMWDGSLEPAVIQTQIKLSLGLTEAAFRDAGTGTALNGGRVDRVGTHAARYGGRRLRGAEWRESTRSFRALVDSVFRRDVDKAQATSLFALNRWQRRR